VVGYVVGGLCILAGISLWGLAIFALVSWVIFCFGTIIIGLLFFAPHLLLFPLAINAPGTWLITLGLGLIALEFEKKKRRKVLPSAGDAALRESQLRFRAELDEMEHKLRLLEIRTPPDEGNK